MQKIHLKTLHETGQPLKAVFYPERGMNLASYTLGDLEVIDPSTQGLFEQRFGGLGPLIGPHFHRRKHFALPPSVTEERFPHIAYFKNDPLPDPFSHGIARYAPWTAESTETSFSALLNGKMRWNDIPLSEIEGQNFEMKFRGQLTPKGLNLHLSIVSDTDSLVGIHYYYHLPNGQGTIRSRVQKGCLENGVQRTIPASWGLDAQQYLNLELKDAIDATLFPFPNPLAGEILLDTQTYQLKTAYSSPSAENSWQLWHKKGASFVCIEPISSQDPRKPNLTASSLQIQLDIISKKEPFSM